MVQATHPQSCPERRQG
uniref:Uncharacterized protein n=1 Tax=Arundo donax TaxID=35708 RepID=A0A0A9HCE7_ARUDO